MDLLPQSQIISWTDSVGTGAVGWIVMHHGLDGVSGGGLFMDASATLCEVKDLAHTMRLKNSLQDPIFSGGKGGIRFDPTHPDAQAVLGRFLKDNAAVIERHWCTGGDLHTTTDQITQRLDRLTGIPSPFVALARYLERRLGIVPDLQRFHDLLVYSAGNDCALEDVVTGYTVDLVFRHVVETPPDEKPKVILQGFGKVGRGAALYLSVHADIVGICEHDWVLYDPRGLDIRELLNGHDPSRTVARQKTQSSEDFFTGFLSSVKADIVCPCAARYTITKPVLEILNTHTFSKTPPGCRWIIAGANNIFAAPELVTYAHQLGIRVVPEWLSNVGSALLFMEALKYHGTIEEWPGFLKHVMDTRIVDFLQRSVHRSEKTGENLYEACIALAIHRMQTKGSQ